MDRMKHILIVDDVTTNLKCAAEVLQDHYKLSMAKSGTQALSFLQKAKPDLILLDVRMPEMDGYETLEHIKSNPETAGIPVVFLTVDDQRESEIKGLKMGAMDFILKPFEPEVMLSRIDKILQIEDLRKNLSMSARKDPLTGLWNRKHLESNLEKLFSQSGATGAFFIFDMDNFKLVNDTYGHIMGDAVLVKFAEILQSKVGPRDIAARVGGDEFVTFLHGDYSSDELIQYCDMIMEIANKELTETVGGVYDISISIGIATVPDDGYSYMELYNKADKALYFVKQNGKSGYHFFKQKEEVVMSEMETVNCSADMARLEKMVEERGLPEGAYRVEYDGFKHIFQFVSRSISRTGQSVHMALFTLKNDAYTKISTEVLEDSMMQLERAIIVSLRQGDVTTQYSSFQYVVLLMNADHECADSVAGRIVDTWNEMNEHEGISLTFDIRKMESKSSL